MDVFHKLDLLRRLSNAAGISGFEQAVQREIRAALPSNFEAHLDGIGNLIATTGLSGAGPRVLLCAHADEIGFVVTGVSPDGLLAFRPVGRWRTRDLVGQRVEVIGLDGPTLGLIESVRSDPFENANESTAPPAFEELLIDIGAVGKEDVAALGVRVGHQVVPFSRFETLANEQSVIGKAFDDRVGVGVMLEALSSLSGSEQAAVTIAATVQEEIGSRGAQALRLEAHPDVAFVLEAIQANDVARGEQADSALGAGPNLVLLDDETVSAPWLVEWVAGVANEEGIRFQLSVAGGTNDAKYIQALGGGVPTLVIGVPCRYIHRHNGLMRIDDYLDTIRLITALVRRIDEKAVRQLA